MSLENELGRVEYLRRIYNGGRAAYSSYLDAVLTRVCATPGFYISEETLSSAESELQKIGTSSEWYSARYAARIALARFDGRPTMCSWICELEKELEANNDISVWDDQKNKAVDLQLPNLDRRLHAVQDLGEILRKSSCFRFYVLNDWAAGFYASERTSKVLKRVYRSDESPQVREEAGKALGYSRLRIWIHERRKSK
jgi:hypothetical protein